MLLTGAHYIPSDWHSVNSSKAGSLGVRIRKQLCVEFQSWPVSPWKAGPCRQPSVDSFAGHCICLAQSAAPIIQYFTCKQGNAQLEQIFFHAFINRPSARQTPTIVWIARLGIPPTLISWEKVNKGDFFEGTAVTLAFEDNGMGSEGYYWKAGRKQRPVCFFLSLWRSIGLVPPGHSSTPLSSSFYLLYSIPFVGGVGLPQEGAGFYAHVHMHIYMFLLGFEWVEEFPLSLLINIYGVSPNEAWWKCDGLSNEKYLHSISLFWLVFRVC